MQEQATKPALIVSSVLRDIDNDKAKDAYIHAISGGKIDDAAAYIRDVPHTKYGALTLLIGGNDCDSDESTCSVEDIVDRYKSLIDIAKIKCSLYEYHCILF